MTDSDKKNHIAFMSQGVFGHNFLDTVQYQFPSTLINASTTINLPLQQVNGKVAFFIITFRPTATAQSATNDAYITTLTDPGDNCTFDITNAVAHRCGPCPLHLVLLGYATYKPPSNSWDPFVPIYL